MQDGALADFALAGGTALALYLGHRISVDLDLFTPYPFDATLLEKHLADTYGFRGDFLEKNTLKGSINNVKFDCISYDYPSLDDRVVTKEGVRLYSIRDIAAMKLSAIADNGTRLKDFIDVAFLSTLLPLSDMLDAYRQKFPNSNVMRPLKGLTYFADINHNEPIHILDGAYNWKNIEKRLRDMIDSPDMTFKSPPLSEDSQVRKRGVRR
jgi:predicted nucleotidyltransferase component of viral defense system